MTKPLVSIITPTFNADRYLPRCLDSVSEQTYIAIEHIIIDGKSTDSTVRIASNYQGNNPVTVLSEHDYGLYDAMSKGIQAANGEYIHILNADDYYSSPDSLSTIIEAMTSSGADLAHGLIELVDENGVTVRVKGADCTRSTLLNKMRIAHPSVVVHRSVYEKFGTFSQCFSIAADQEWLLRVWDKIQTTFIEKPLVKMQTGGLAISNVEKSYRQSCSVAILHGQNPLLALFNYYLERFKHQLLSMTGRL